MPNFRKKFIRLANYQKQVQIPYIFPNLVAGNIAYKLLMELERAHAIGPELLGLNKSFHILQLGTSIREIVRMAAIAAIQERIVEKRDELIAKSD